MQPLRRRVHRCGTQAYDPLSRDWVRHSAPLAPSTAALEAQCRHAAMQSVHTTCVGQELALCGTPCVGSEVQELRSLQHAELTALLQQCGCSSAAELRTKFADMRFRLEAVSKTSEEEEDEEPEVGVWAGEEEEQLAHALKEDEEQLEALAELAHADALTNAYSEHTLDHQWRRGAGGSATPVDDLENMIVEIESARVALELKLVGASVLLASLRQSVEATNTTKTVCARAPLGGVNFGVATTASSDSLGRQVYCTADLIEERLGDVHRLISTGRVVGNLRAVEGALAELTEALQCEGEAQYNVDSDALYEDLCQAQYEALRPRR